MILGSTDADVAAYLRSRVPHRHEWRELSPHVEWCPPCGAARQAQQPETD